MSAKHRMRFPIVLSRLTRTLLVFALALNFLYGCGAAQTSSGLIARVNPPSMAIQHLKINTPTSASLTLRLQNFSTVPMIFEKTDFQLSLINESLSLDTSLSLEVPGLSSETTEISIPINEQLSQKILSAYKKNHSVDYTITGHIETSSPSGKFKLEYESALSPIPGKINEFR
jgi:hypothetical protein